MVTSLRVPKRNDAVLIAGGKIEGKSLGNFLPQKAPQIGMLLTELTGITAKVEEKVLGF